MAETPNVLRETDDEALRLARRLVRAARFAALAVVDPETGDPLASRVLLATDVDGVPVVLVSALSGHTRPLATDGRASLLAGEPGKGDPLAHPRISVRCRAARLERGSADHARVRERFLRRHPKAGLYADFGDFAFFRLVPSEASLNGGFGKAYRLEGRDLLIESPAVDELAAIEAEAIAHMNEDHEEAASLLARHYAGVDGGDWRINGLDAAGIDLQSGDRQVRIAFASTLRSADELRARLSALLDEAR